MDVEHGVRVLAERPAEDFEPTEEEARTAVGEELGGGRVGEIRFSTG